MTHPPPLGVEVSDLTLRYGQTVALDGLTVSLAPGRIYGLIGRNGSGKTSLMSVLAAFRRASAGSVRVDGDDPYENERLTSAICLIRESGDVFVTDKCAGVLRMAGLLRPHWDKAFAEHLVERFEVPLHKTPQQLSRGQRSALACILGLASRAPLTMFDESYLGMDAPSRYAFSEELLADYAAHPRTIIISTHLIEEFGALFEQVVMIDNGRLLLHEDTDTLRARGAAVTGPTDAIDRFRRDATGLTVLGEKRLGGTVQVTLYGPLGDEQRRRVAADGLALEPVALQDLFVHLTGQSADPATAAGVGAGIQSPRPDGGAR